MKTNKDVRSFAPVELQNAIMDMDRRGQVFHCDGRKYHYFLYLTRVQGDIDMLFRMPKDVWKKAQKRWGEDIDHYCYLLLEEGWSSQYCYVYSEPIR